MFGVAFLNMAMSFANNAVSFSNTAVSFAYTPCPFANRVLNYFKCVLFVDVTRCAWCIVEKNVNIKIKNRRFLRFFLENKKRQKNVKKRQVKITIVTLYFCTTNGVINFINFNITIALHRTTTSAMRRRTNYWDF